VPRTASARASAMRRFLTIDEVSKLVRCEHRTVRRAIKRGELDAALIGGKWLVRPGAVDSWFESRRPSLAPPASSARARGASRPRAGAIRAERPGSVARLQALDGN